MERTYRIDNEVLLKGQQYLKKNIDLKKIKKIMMIFMSLAAIISSLILFYDYSQYKAEGYEIDSINRYMIGGFITIIIATIIVYFIVLKALWSKAFNKYKENDINIITSTENGYIYKQFRNDKQIYSVDISECKIISSSKIENMKIIIYMKYRRIPEYIIIPKEYSES